MPDHKVRPSALTPLGSVFSALNVATTTLLGKQYSNLLLYSSEKGIMVSQINNFNSLFNRTRLMNNYAYLMREVFKKAI